MTHGADGIVDGRSSLIHETEYDGGPADRDRYRRRVMERILTQFEHLGSIGRDNLDYLVDKLARLEEVA